MKIVIAGGTGFLGNALRDHFRSLRHEVQVLTRKPRGPGDVAWDGQGPGDWSRLLDGADVLINLAGRSVDCRYTAANRKQVLSSRILSTRALQQAVNDCRQPPRLWINASSATAYIHATTVLMDEYSGIVGDDFSMNVCKAWESEFFRTGNDAVRKVAIRTSIVLGNTGGAYPRLKTLVRAGMGGCQGRGDQMVSWIHLEDFCRALDFIITESTLNGIVNVTAPNPVANRDFMAALRRRCHMPFGCRLPVWLLEPGAALIGTETELLLKSRNVFPQKLLEAGFVFQYPVVDAALQYL